MEILILIVFVNFLFSCGLVKAAREEYVNGDGSEPNYFVLFMFGMVSGVVFLLAQMYSGIRKIRSKEY